MYKLLANIRVCFNFLFDLRTNREEAIYHYLIALSHFFLFSAPAVSKERTLVGCFFFLRSAHFYQTFCIQLDSAFAWIGVRRLQRKHTNTVAIANSIAITMTILQRNTEHCIVNRKQLYVFISSCWQIAKNEAHLFARIFIWSSRKKERMLSKRKKATDNLNIKQLTQAKKSTTKSVTHRS